MLAQITTLSAGKKQNDLKNIMIEMLYNSIKHYHGFMEHAYNLNIKKRKLGLSLSFFYYLKIYM